MSSRKSLDDTCDIFLSRRRVHSPFVHQRTTSGFSSYTPPLCAENIRIAESIRIPSAPEFPRIFTPPPTFNSTSTKPLPLPGSSGALQTKPTRLANGHYHIPRPRNPFILFRCDLVHQRKALPRSDLDDTNISRIAGDLWREMTAAQKKPWVDLAAQEKARHALLYPDYKYAPGHTSSKTKKAKSEIAHSEDRPPRQISHMGPAFPRDHSSRRSERPRPYPQSMPRRRSVSCPPPGAVKVNSRLDVWTPTLVSKDDIQRHSVQTETYHSTTPPSDVEAITPIVPRGHDLNPVFDWPGVAQISSLAFNSVDQYPPPDMSQNCDAYASVNYYFPPYKPSFGPGTADPELTAEELQEIERLAAETTFSDPFSNIAAVPVDNYSFAFAMSMPTFDHSTDSPSSLSSGTMSSN